ncbi:MAG: zf-HC2 domain-containing protein [Anaerolineae bacterium]|nr:zf-HC2 domain-containing protein [Anaerolineae bacterium]
MQHLSDETLNEILDHALAPSQRAGVESHLAACPECAARLDELRALFAELDSLPDLALNVDFAPAILARVRQNAPIPRPVRWLTLAQSIGAIIAGILAWPLVETILQPLKLPSLAEVLAGAASFWLQVTADLRLPDLTFQTPTLGLDLTSTSVTIAIVSVSVLWLAANGLLLIPRSRRTS